jgi:hypothetical protein
MPRPWLLPVLLLAGALLALRPAPGVAAREAPAPAAAPKGPPSPEILALAGGDAERETAALALLRGDPAAARAALLAALQRDPPLPGRWRLIYRLEEFGKEEDVPLLLQLRENAQNPWERRIAEGAARALYEPVLDATGLESVVQDFSFIQTHRPTPLDEPSQGKWMLTRWSLGDYHRDDVPLAVIKELRGLRGKPFDTRQALADALQKRLTARDWKALRDRLLASAETVPARTQLEGLARVRLLNPLQRPLLLRLSLDAWFGGFREPPGEAWVYLEAGAAQTVDIPVAPQGLTERQQMRLDLRMKQVDGPFIPDFHKLYLALQP